MKPTTDQPITDAELEAMLDVDGPMTVSAYRLERVARELLRLRRRLAELEDDWASKAQAGRYPEEPFETGAYNDCALEIRKLLGEEPR